MSIKEYMKSRNISRQTIYNRMEKGLLKTVKEGNKIYIVKELSNSRRISKLNSEIIDFKAIQESMEIIKNSNDILKKFDYSFLRSRLSSIEKALIDFKMDINKSNDILLQKFSQFTENISEKIQDVENRIINLENKFENYLSSVNEYHENTKNNFNENILLTSENKTKLEILENKLIQLDEKLEEILKKADNSKKPLNIFKR